MSSETFPTEFRSADFVASGAYKSVPLGGINEYSVDTSIILNAPTGPDGEPMIFMWGYPESAPDKLRQGIQPVPSVAFKRPCWGNKDPLRATSATVDLSREHVFKEGGMLMLFFTTATNYKRIERVRDEAGLRAQFGTGALDNESTREFNNAAMGGRVFTQEQMTNMGIPVKPPKPAKLAAPAS